MLGMSACLAGINCKYTGGNNVNETCRQLAESDNVILICPEVITLGCPREAAEIVGIRGGKGVWNGTAQVITVSGRNVTSQYKEGALSCLDNLKSHGDIQAVILQSRSPSCGVGKIYDGTFSRHLITGDGVLASLLKGCDIPVYDVEEYFKGYGEE